MITEVKIKINELGKVTDKTLSERSVVAENENFILLDDEFFTRLTKKKSWSNIDDMLDKISISVSKTDFDLRIFGFMRIRVYSTASKKITENRINKALKKYVENELKFYGGLANVSIVL